MGPDEQLLLTHPDDALLPVRHDMADEQVGCFAPDAIVQVPVSDTLVRLHCRHCGVSWEAERD